MQKYMKAVSIKEVVRFQKQGTREEKSFILLVIIFLGPKLISAFIDGSESLIY